ncbi:hypothetical protein TIFTF001_001884 [Ficus carica]|uniref:Uncharacterized protein n=1 Tax=Ficus carica TaxID=3494 RepID=A0AA88D5W9_FICCA|nr:hypothetical protein TIFTF001_001884 [Ficus carica]
MLKMNVDAAVCPGRDFCGVSAAIRDCEENVLESGLLPRGVRPSPFAIEDPLVADTLDSV